MASPDGVSVQTVKLKILYTFDADSKDNHLTRWPHPVDVNTCFIDNSTQIGAVDLQTCLEAIINASPEINRVDQDYAVYAFDYSEEDTPLVGQGMLSRALAMQNEGVEQDGEALITGKISLGAMGLLSKNAQPTLEVKLRFKPVNITPVQRMRSGSISSQDGRPAWLQIDDNLSQNPRPSSPMDTTGLQTMQRMLSEGGPPRERTGSIAPETYPYSRPGSRAGTPTLSQTFNPPPRQPADTYPRPDSRNGVRSQSHARRDSFNSGYYSGEDNTDDGPARKRAKTSKVDWPSKSNFNIEQQPNSLRVAASTAQSVRIHRPIAMSPAQMLQTGTLGEDPVRPPTPIPINKNGKPRGRVGRPKRSGPSNLARTASTPNPVALSLSSSLNLPPPSEAMDTAVSSPEDARPRSTSTTPANIPSSPPMIPEQPGPLITSPSLPPMPMPMPMMNQDSGFLSGNLEDLFDDGTMIPFDEFIMDKPDDQTPDLVFNAGDMHYTPVFEEGNDIDPTQPPQLTDASQQQQEPSQKEQISFPAPPPPPRPMSRSQSFTPVYRPGISSPKLAPAPIPRARQIMEERKAKGLLPKLGDSEPGPRSLQRSNTWAPDNSDALMSEAIDGDDQSRAKSKKKIGKEQTRARLDHAIASGEMPPYCENCGAIETPAWRRAWTKTFDSGWDEVETSLSPGGIVFKEILSHHPDGSVKEFKGMKADKVPGDEDDGWEQINLCNPCGLWFHKQKYPRPKEKWQKKTDNRGRRKGGSKGQQGQKKPLNARSDAPTPMSDESSPADTATEAPDFYDNEFDNTTGKNDGADSNEPQLPTMPQGMRATSAEPLRRGLARARPERIPATRQVKSSPGQVRGSEAEPIEVDLTPRPTRRQLFPSPNHPQIGSDPTGPIAVMKATASLPNFVRRSPRLGKTKDVFQIPGVAGGVALAADGKENMMPEIDVVQDLGELYDVGVDDNPPPPSTPTPTRRSERLIQKTPRQFGDEVSTNAVRSPTFRTPKPKNGQHPVIGALLGTVNSKLNLSEMTPFARAIAGALSDAYDPGQVTPPDGQSGSKKATPHKNIMFDFPDLPSLNNSSPMNVEQMLNINFSELPTDLHTDFNDMFSTDAPVPSSPPGFYNFINPDGDLDSTVHWDDSTSMEPASESLYPDPETMSLAPVPSQVLRRSPRKGKR